MRSPRSFRSRWEMRDALKTKVRGARREPTLEMPRLSLIVPLLFSGLFLLLGVRAWQRISVEREGCHASAAVPFDRGAESSAGTQPAKPPKDSTEYCLRPVIQQGRSSSPSPLPPVLLSLTLGLLGALTPPLTRERLSPLQIAPTFPFLRLSA